MPRYVGLVPFPTPGSTGEELRENVPFSTCLTVLRSATRKRGGMAADPEGRCFRIFQKDWARLVVYFGTLRIGSKISGRWEFVRRGPAFGVVLTHYLDHQNRHVPVPARSRTLDPSRLTRRTS